MRCRARRSGGRDESEDGILDRDRGHDRLRRGSRDAQHPDGRWTRGRDRGGDRRHHVARSEGGMRSSCRTPISSLYSAAANRISICEGDFAVIPATQIKVGMVILHDGKPCRVTNVLHVTPGNWRGMVHAKMVNLVTGSQVEYRFRSEDKVERADLDHHPLQYLYRSGDEFTFMNTENYEMSSVPPDVRYAKTGLACASLSLPLSWP